MTEYLRTGCRRSWKIRSCLLATAFAVLFTILASLPAAAQNRRANSDSTQARLTITAQIMPVVILPPRPASQTSTTIAYNVPSLQMPLTVTEKIQPLDKEGAVLKTVTVVPR